MRTVDSVIISEEDDETARAVIDMYNHYSILANVSDETLSHLPPYLLYTYGSQWVASVEHRLPPHILQRADIQQLLYCQDHYVNNYPGDHIDGPPSRRIDCVLCREQNDCKAFEKKKKKKKKNKKKNHCSLLLRFRKYFMCHKT